jgi:hypothetical protein
VAVLAVPGPRDLVLRYRIFLLVSPDGAILFEIEPPFTRGKATAMSVFTTSRTSNMLGVLDKTWPTTGSPMFRSLPHTRLLSSVARQPH